MSGPSFIECIEAHPLFVERVADYDMAQEIVKRTERIAELEESVRRLAEAKEIDGLVIVSREEYERIAELEQENADLWAFVRADDEWTLHDQSEDRVGLPSPDWVTALDKREAARDALRKYETDTSDSEAMKRAEPRTLGTDTIDTEETKG